MDLRPGLPQGEAPRLIFFKSQEEKGRKIGSGAELGVSIEELVELSETFSRLPSEFGGTLQTDCQSTARIPLLPEG